MGRAKPFSPQTLAERWECSAQKIRQMCRAGEIGWFPVGPKLMRIPANEVERIECQSIDSSSIEANGASPTELPAVELRLARMTGDGQNLSLVKSGDGSRSRSQRG
jgi:hypothetical protein